jgi:hypothetical protein
MKISKPLYFIAGLLLSSVHVHGMIIEVSIIGTFDPVAPQGDGILQGGVPTSLTFFLNTDLADSTFSTTSDGGNTFFDFYYFPAGDTSASNAVIQIGDEAVNTTVSGFSIFDSKAASWMLDEQTSVALIGDGFTITLPSADFADAYTMDFSIRAYGNYNLFDNLDLENIEDLVDFNVGAAVSAIDDPMYTITPAGIFVADADISVISAVPEPATVALWISGLSCLIAGTVRRRALFRSSKSNDFAVR